MPVYCTTMPIDHQPATRRGLSESLQEFAARIGVEPERARSLWALLGLHALQVIPPDEPAVSTLNRLSDSLRIAPGLAVPTGAVKL